MKLNLIWKNVALRKAILAMKLLLLLLLTTAAQIFANETLAQKINFSGQKVEIREILSAIEKQSGYLFFYDENLIVNSKPITVDFTDKNIGEAMDEICAEQIFTWSVEKQTITLVEKQQANANPKTKTTIAKPLITGRVTDESGNPLPGASVVLKGTTIGTTTDDNGNFSFEATTGNVLIISFVGFTTQQVIVGLGSMDVVLRHEISKLDEIQITGYGTTTKRFSTSAISSIKAEIIEHQAVTNPLQALQGRVAGLSIVQNSGAIGSGMEIQIRGVNSIESGTQPLIIIDGAIVPSQGLVTAPTDARSTTAVGGYMTSSIGTTSFNTINPEDVESIEILKDADATSIYGSRGSNGVILITTKKAKLGKSNLTVDVSHGVNMATYIQKRMNLDQYLTMRKDAFAMGLYNPTTGVAINPVIPTTANAPDLTSWSQTESTDWPEYEYGNPAHVNKVQADFSGGNKNLSFILSGGYFRQEDITMGDPYQERKSGRVNLNHLSNDEKLQVIFNASYSTDKLSPSKGNGTVQGLPPNMPQYEADGSTWWPKSDIIQNSMLVNPSAVEEGDIGTVTGSLLSNLDVSYKLIKNLRLKAQIGYNIQSSSYSATSPSSGINPYIPSTNVPTLSVSQNNFQSLNFEPQINYSGKLFRGKFEAMMGSTLFSRNSKSMGMVFQGFSTDLLLHSMAAATTVTSKSSANYYYSFASVFGRLNYNLDNKYLINLTYRRDGSSRFGPDNKYGNFGAVGLAWLFTSEPFVKKSLPFLNYGKFRISYGSTGNDNISEYRFTSLYTATGVYYNGVSGLASTYLSDPSIGWERSNKLDFGLELGILKDRILLTANRFKTHVVNMLLSQTISGVTGFGSFLTNMPGLIENKGWEFDLTTKNLGSQSKLQWRTNFNLTLLKNTLLEYPDLKSSSQATRLEIGKPVRSQNTYSALFERTIKYEGINPNTGIPIYTDVDKNGSISTTDYQYIGSAIPRTYGGLGNTLSFKGFDFDIFFQFSQQLTNNYIGMSTYAGQLNNPSSQWVGNYWKQPGDLSTLPRLYPGVGSNTSVAYMTSYFPVSSAGATDLLYVRLKNLQLSYSLPAALISKLKLSRAQLYVRGQNLFVWTSQKIYKDPETVLQASMMLKNWTTGIQLSF